MRNKTKILIFIILVIFLFSIIDIYYFDKPSFISRGLVSVIPYPALIMDNKIISVKEYNKLENIYKKELYGEEFVKKEFLRDVVLRYEFSKDLAKKMKIKYTQKDFEIYINNFYNQAGISKDKKQDLEFQNYIIKPAFLEYLLSEKLSSNEYNAQNKKKIESIYAQLLKDPSLFENYANSFKDNYVAFDNGVLGWLPQEDLPEDLKGLVSSMQINSFTPVMKSLAGYHIYKLVAKTQDDKNNQSYYQISQIFLPTMNFNLYFQDFLKNKKIIYLVKY